MKIKIGCCGFPVGRKEYYKYFRVVELQSTFYQVPRLDTVNRWREEAPPGFEFAIKAWQLITHSPTSPTYRRLKLKIKESRKKGYGFFKPTDEVFLAYEKLCEIAKILRAKIILFQSPASFRPCNENVNNIKKFFKKVKRYNFIFAWEPRGEWPQGLIMKLCKELNLNHCVDPFKTGSVYGEIKYYRLHGLTGYNYRYKEVDLMRLKRLLDRSLNIYVLFNNTNMFKDALAFKKLCGML